MLSISTSALLAHKKTITQIAKNIANMNVPGYHKIDTQLSPRHIGGVDVASIERNFSEALEKKVFEANSELGSLNVQNQHLSYTESVVDNMNLEESYDTIYSNLEQLSIDPTNTHNKELVLNDFDRHISKLNELGDHISREKIGIQQQIRQVEENNELKLENIKDLDQRISKLFHGSSKPFELMDKRDNMIAELAETSSVNVTYLKDGDTSISIDNNSGTIGGLQKSYDTLEAIETDLNYYSIKFKDDINNVSPDLITGEAAQDLKMNNQENFLEMIEEGDNSKVLEMLETKNNDWFDFKLDIGIGLNNINDSLDFNTAIKNTLQNQIADETGVDLDTQLAKLMEAKQAYEASANVLKVQQEINNTLLGLL